MSRCAYVHAHYEFLIFPLKEHFASFSPFSHRRVRPFCLPSTIFFYRFCLIGAFFVNCLTTKNIIKNFRIPEHRYFFYPLSFLLLPHFSLSFMTKNKRCTFRKPFRFFFFHISFFFLFLFIFGEYLCFQRAT